jgi:tight adherence protein C
MARILFQIFFIILINQLWLTNAYAECSKNFDKIDSRCIRETASNKEFGRIKFSVPKNGEKIQDQTFFYITEHKHFGKFIVSSSYRSANECSVFLSATTYVGSRIYNPSATFTIKREFDTWTSDRGGFDETSSNDFVLSMENGTCVFASNLATGYNYGKLTKDTLFGVSELVVNAAYFLIGLAVFLVASAVFREEDKFKAQETLEDADTDSDRKNAPQDFILKYSKPFFKRYFTPIVQGMRNKKKLRDKYRRKLASSGLTKVITPEDLFAFKLFLIIGFPIVFIILREFLEEDWPMALIPVLSVVGFAYPDIWVNGKIEKRRKEMIMNMPFVVDMLALSVEAGLDFMAAMQKVIEKAPPSALTEEFEILIKETKVGASRAEGLRQLAWRADTLSISSFCATLIAADAVGASIGPILKTLAAELRQKKSAEAEKAGATAATKILFPMMFFIMPSVFLIIAAPIVMQFMAGQ